MSLLGLVALIGCVLGGAVNADAPRTADTAHSVLSTDAGSCRQMALAGKLPVRPRSRPQANDSDHDGDDGSSGEDLTASLDDDDYHVTALVWQRLIVVANVALSMGNLSVSLEGAAAGGLECDGHLSPVANSLRSMHVCLQI